MFRITPLTAIAALALALAATVRIEEHRLASERSRTASAALATSNLVAQRDSAHNAAAANAAVARLLGDSLHVVKNKSLQVAQRGAALDKALARERRAKYTFAAEVDSLQRLATAIPSVDSNRLVRAATFNLRAPPYTVAAYVEVPPPPDSATLSLQVALDPIHIDARLTCSSPNEQGIRTASIVASSPSWATVRFDRLEQSPELCASPAPTRAQPGRRRVDLKRLVIGVGRGITPNGSGVWALFVGAGIQIAL